MSLEASALQKARVAYQPKLPKALRQHNIRVKLGAPAYPATQRQALKKAFPKTYGQRVAAIVAGGDGMHRRPLRAGVVLSGGPAPGGHNVIAGLFDALKATHTDSKLFGFLKGPGGLIHGKLKELTSEAIAPFRNTGGFNLLMSGRDKIEKPEHLAACEKHLADLDLDGLVVIGGDDSNTNAAVLAEYLRARGARTCVIGVPKTIDGDMKNREIETSFGFDTAAKTYSELIGNVCRDAQSSVKYWHFIRLMGRAASHITLECALQTHPNVALISEEIQARRMTLSQVVDGLVDVIVKRAKAGTHYGIVLVPEGLPEFVPEIKTLLGELSVILGKDDFAGMKYVAGLRDHNERVQYLNNLLTDHSARVYGQLPPDIQAVLQTLDKHGYPLLSQVETERLLIDLVTDKIRLLRERGHEDPKFSPLSHFLGYEGRCGAPSNFDADYGYALGYTAAHLICAGLSSYTVYVGNLTQSRDKWVAGGTPITAIMNIEMRKGKPTPVVRKALVDLNGGPFKTFARERDAWALNDAYVFPGPMQFFGPPEICDAPTVTMMLERP
ncbi:MAG: diphosphate--fructose-6-phosphate 1-phosphotransferase [Planctomycetota bacterium]|nr:diphosphate--fructose-6-phosphate 1-phosphotransferase [Planctomycetota bacterium]